MHRSEAAQRQKQCFEVIQRGFLCFHQVAIRGRLSADSEASEVLAIDDVSFGPGCVTVPGTAAINKHLTTHTRLAQTLALPKISPHLNRPRQTRFDNDTGWMRFITRWVIKIVLSMHISLHWTLGSQGHGVRVHFLSHRHMLHAARWWIWYRSAPRLSLIKHHLAFWRAASPNHSCYYLS